MGLGIHSIEPLTREHLYRPIDGDLVTIGRQTIYFSPEQVIALLTEHGIDTSGVDPRSVEIDHSTIDRLPGYQEKTFISDRGLFRFFEVKSIKALDRSDYEGAEIIHDLSQPLPLHFRSIADFVIDGSTLDNTFNPTLTLRNYCEMLRPGGRILMANTFSCYNTPYCIMPPLWYLDYFVMNGFSDCKAYVLVFEPPDANPRHWNSYWLDLHWLQRERRRMGRFVSSFEMSCIIFAEKGANSTTDVYPVQQDYRSEQDWEIYARNLAVMQQSKRPHLLRSNGPVFVPDVIGGHLFIDTEFDAVAPVMKAPATARLAARARGFARWRH